MDNNLHEMERVIDYIEDHLLEEKLDLDSISKAMGYSKYHLHRMFTAVVGMSLHCYITRRRLTEAARMLASSNKPILEIALLAGYETQRSFSRSFKSLMKRSPDAYRRRKEFLPLQLKTDLNKREAYQGNVILDVETAMLDSVSLVGYSRSTKRGFQVTGTCWRLLHKNKRLINNRMEEDFLIGLNDYSAFEKCGSTPCFQYLAGAQVSSLVQIPKGMKGFTFPPSAYVAFSFRQKSEDSMEPVAEYIYGQWFPHSACHFNEKNLYDFVKYKEAVDENGQSEIEYWVPIKDYHFSISKEESPK